MAINFVGCTTASTFDIVLPLRQISLNRPVAGREKVPFYFLNDSINALIPDVLLSRPSDEKKCIFFASEVRENATFWNGLWLVDLAVT